MSQNQINIEKEKSFIFMKKDLKKIIEILSDQFGSLNKKYIIEDWYLNKNTRIRWNGQTQEFRLETKEGEKTKGRKEKSVLINFETYQILKNFSKLYINKDRFEKQVNDDFIISLDVFKNPMEICILEIELLKSTEYPEFINRFIECPLSAWNYFKRRIGISAGPSSGKTETAKKLSNLINIELQGNSYYCSEVCTEFIQKFERYPTQAEELIIFNEQLEKEINAFNKHDIIISDSPTFLPYVYSLLHNENHLITQKLYDECLKDLKNYTDLIYLKPLGTYKYNNIRCGRIIADKATKIIKAFIENHTKNTRELYCFDTQYIFEKLFYINNLDIKQEGTVAMEIDND